MSGSVVFLIIDAIALWGLASLACRQNMSDHWFGFMISAGALMLVGLYLTFTTVSLPMALGAYLATVFVTLRFIVDAPWLGSLLGALGFIVYKGAANWIMASFMAYPA